MNIIPIGDKVIIEMIPVSNETKGGILIPESAMNSLPKANAIVKAVGPGIYQNGMLIPMEVKIGDMVIVTPAAYSSIGEIIVNNKVYYVINPAGILCILEEDE